jgi:hypothetical protein
MPIVIFDRFNVALRCPVIPRKPPLRSRQITADSRSDGCTAALCTVLMKFCNVTALPELGREFQSRTYLGQVFEAAAQHMQARRD